MVFAGSGRLCLSTAKWFDEVRSEILSVVLNVSFSDFLLFGFILDFRHNAIPIRLCSIAPLMTRKRGG
jgi:hypothetical protein